MGIGVQYGYYKVVNRSAIVHCLGSAWNFIDNAEKYVFYLCVRVCLYVALNMQLLSRFHTADDGLPPPDRIISVRKTLQRLLKGYYAVNVRACVPTELAHPSSA